MKKIILLGLLFVSVCSAKAQITIAVADIPCPANVCISAINTCNQTECPPTCIIVAAHSPQNYNITPACSPLIVPGLTCFNWHISITLNCPPGDCLPTDAGNDWFIDPTLNYDWRGIGPCEGTEWQWQNGVLYIGPQ